MLAEIGHLFLILYFCFSLYGFIYYFPCRETKSDTKIIGFQSACLLSCLLTLFVAFYHNDFSVSYVAANSNIELPWYYRLSALWGAHEGSFLLWLFIYQMWCLAFAWFAKTPLKSTMLFCLNAMGTLFASFVLFASNPFLRILPIMPKEGASLNPLLQDPGLIIHPPILYIGYVGLVIPFAFTIATLLKPKEEVDLTWLRTWCMASWAALCLGITLGSFWAYYELGWGGWWFWDPVENASLMPWIVATALLHAIRLHNKQNSALHFVFFLSILAFGLSLLGTFLVRSGVLTSVHSFAADPGRGLYILAMFATIIGSSLLLYFWRAPYFEIKKPFANGRVMVLGMLLLTALALIILLGTLYPLIIDALLGEQLSVGPHYFNALFVPILTAIVLVMGLANPRRKEYVPIVIAMVITTLLAYFLDMFGHIAKFSLCLMAIWMMLNLKTNRPVMFIAHGGLAVSILAGILVTHLEKELDVPLSVGQHLSFQGFDFHFKSQQILDGPNYSGMQAHFVVKGPNSEFSLFPEKRFYKAQKMPLSEIALHFSLSHDFYLAIAEPLDNDTWAIRLYDKPYVRFLWIGGVIMAGAFLMTVISARLKKRRLIYAS